MSRPDFDVEKIARLAYLKLSTAEHAAFKKQFESLLQYVDQLKSVPMSAEEGAQMGAFHITDAFYELFQLDPSKNLRSEREEPKANAGSQEISTPSSLNLSNEEALRNAPQKSGIPGELLFEVPSIIERG